MDVFMGFNPLTTGGAPSCVVEQKSSCDPKDGFRWRRPYYMTIRSVFDYVTMGKQKNVAGYNIDTFHSNWIYIYNYIYIQYIYIYADFFTSVQRFLICPWIDWCSYWHFLATFSTSSGFWSPKNCQDADLVSFQAALEVLRISPDSEKPWFFRINHER